MKISKVENVFCQLVAGGEADYEISHRGGHYGFDSGYLVDALFPNVSDSVREKILSGMPRKYGVYCNYLGGGIRGAVSSSGFASDLPKYVQKALSEIADHCKSSYHVIESEMGLIDEGTDDEPNWDNIASNASRAAGVKSAY